MKNKLFSTIQVGKLTLKNRIQFAPMVSCHATPHGRVTSELVEFLGMQARSGASLITIGATAVSKENGEDFDGAISVTDDSDIAGLSLLSEEVHRFGALLSVELNHAGRGADPSLLLKEPYAASNFPLPHRSRNLKIMTQVEIDEVVAQFADCAERCMKSGFDFIMVHGAHGNLIGSFLSPLVNTRTDMYGGSLQNRMRFPLEVLKAIREKCGDKLGIEYRISGDERAPGGLKIDEVVAFAKVAQDYIDLIHISGGMVVDEKYQKYCFPTTYSDYCVNVENARKVKEAIDIPVAVVGSIQTPEQAEEIINSGAADIVAIARQNLADGFFANKVKLNQYDSIRPCIRCIKGCGEIFFGRQIRCSINPKVGRESRFRNIPLAKKKKNVVVIGGGVAGMMATQICIERGHNVTLYEKNAVLGGLLHEASTLPFKKDLKRYMDWNIKETESCGANVYVNTEATKKLLMNQSPDAIILATGSYDIKPKIKGIDNNNIHSYIEVDANRISLGKKVIVCGAGLTGAETALALAMQGKEVTLVDKINKHEMFSGLFFIVRNHLFDLLNEHNVTILDEHNILEFTSTGVKLLNKEFKEKSIYGDDVVIALGRKESSSMFDWAKDIASEFYVIGDAHKVNDIHYANHSAFNICVEI